MKQSADSLMPPLCIVLSLRDLFRPTSHLSAVKQQELLRHGFRNHKHSPQYGLDRYFRAYPFSDEDFAATAGCGSRYICCFVKIHHADSARWRATATAAF
jgi:hypothetical protein